MQLNPLSEQIAQNLYLLLKKHSLEVSKEDILRQLTTPPNSDHGQMAFPCFRFSKALKKSPPQIAQEFCQELELPKSFESATAAGPYINLKLNLSESARELLPEVLSRRMFENAKVSTDISRKQMFEYSQPNTHKELHVGHMRNLCLGNAIVKMTDYLGHKAVPVTYPGDVGTHVAKTLWFLKHRNTTPAPEGSKGAWLGEMYALATKQLEEERGTDKEDENRETLTKILMELKKGEGEFFDLWQQTRKWSIEQMQEAYDWADVKFDRWYFESEVDHDSVELAKEMLSKGQYIESEGAVGMDLSDDKLGFCMVIKSDGTGLYATKDILLAQRKFEEFKIDDNIYIVDKRQAHHFKQVFKVLEKTGFPRAESCLHLQYGYVKLASGLMKSREGSIIPLMSLINQMEDMIKEKYLSRYSAQWSQEEINLVATQVANGAIKYGMLKVDAAKDITFDMEEWLKLDGETGPYLQYVHARITSMCSKLDEGLKDVSADWSTLCDKAELKLLSKIAHFNNVLIPAAEQKRTAPLCLYLYELGKLFNHFYVECPISKAPDKGLQKARLELSKACGITMKEGLSLLGIPAPARM